MMWPLTWLPYGMWWFVVRPTRSKQSYGSGVTAYPELPANDPGVAAYGYVPCCHDGEDY
jgi:hypothetical protein